MVHGSGLRVMVAGGGGLEWISMVKVLTIDLFTTRCLCHHLQLATDVDRGELGALQFIGILVFRRGKLKCG